MIQVNRIYLIFNRLVTKKFLVDTSGLLYILRDGVSSYFIASLSGYRNGVSHFKLICGEKLPFKLYQKLNGSNYFDFILECPNNSGGYMEIKAMDDLTVIETTEPLSDWQQIATE